MRCSLLIFSFMNHAFDVRSKNLLPCSISKNFSPIFFSKIFLVLCFRFMPGVPLGLILVSDVRFRSKFIFCQRMSKCSSIIYSLNCFGTLVKIQLVIFMWVYLWVLCSFVLIYVSSTLPTLFNDLSTVVNLNII